MDIRSSQMQDRMLENIQLFVTHALLAVDFHKSIWHCEVMRLEKNLEIAVVCLCGSSKNNYARILLE